MIIKKNRSFTGILIILLAIFSMSVFSNCSQPKKGDDLKEAAGLIREVAMKANPALKGKKLNVSMVIDGGLNEVCACLYVCDNNGNCTKCSCSPANCGSCK